MQGDNIIFISDRYTAVSYTHLDVYKRQLYHGVEVLFGAAGIFHTAVGAMRAFFVHTCLLYTSSPIRKSGRLAMASQMKRYGIPG